MRLSDVTCKHRAQKRKEPVVRKWLRKRARRVKTKENQIMRCDQLE